MYLSKLVLNSRNRRVIKEINSPYEMHRTISKAFYSEDSLPGNRILFRVEPGNERAVTLIIQSQVMPQWSKLTVENDYFYGDNIPQTKKVELKIIEGLNLLFRLRANPTKREKVSRKRIGIYSEEELLNWIIRKGEENGFSVSSVNIAKEPKVKTGVKGQEIRHFAEFNSVLFSGNLLVKNADLFIGAIYNGIGSAKGFGFGLLSIALMEQ